MRQSAASLVLARMGLRDPTDLDSADSWGANCGPAALAAALGLDLAAVRAAVSDGDTFRGYMGIAHMRAAMTKMECLGEQWSMPRRSHLATVGQRPVIMLLQWHGPWDAVPRAAATHRHWVAAADRVQMFVYDVNAGWCPRDFWMHELRPALVPKRGTGEFTVTWGAAIKDPR